MENRSELLQSIRDGKYRPNPIRRVEITKENGKKRLLGIPTVVDRVVQQAITQVLSPIYEQQFSPHSHGFRPGKNAHQALKKCRDYITDGNVYAVDMDLQQYGPVRLVVWEVRQGNNPYLPTRLIYLQIIARLVLVAG